MKSKRKEVDLSIPEMIEGRIKNLENQAETLTNMQRKPEPCLK